jgi:hypothetical protein
VDGHGRTARAVRTLAYSYVRWHARGLARRRTRWTALRRSGLVMLATVLVVVAIAQAPVATCGVVDLEFDTGDLDVPAVSAAAALGAIGLWLVAIVASIAAIRRVLAIGQRRSVWMYPNWRRRIQGAGASALGRWSFVAALVAVLWVPAAGVCEVPDWIAVPVGLAFFLGLLLTVFGAAVSTEAGWVGFALVVVIDLLSVCLLLGYALIDPERRQFALVGAVAFGIHATCTTVACRWSFVVGTMPGARADDRAKAGETGRSLCALWVLLLIAYLVVIFDETLLDRAVSLLTSPVVVALTLGALAVTLGSGHTKYVEAREAAGRRVRDRRSARTMTFDRRDDLVPRIAARMIASCGPLPTGTIAEGVNRMSAVAVDERRMRRELAASDLLTRTGADTWDLAPEVDPHPHRWPTDRSLQRLCGDDRLTTAVLEEKLDAAGYRGLPAPAYLRPTHPLIRREGRGRSRRWSVLPGEFCALPAVDGSTGRQRR